MTPSSIVEPVPEQDSIRGVVEPTGYRILVRIPNLESQMKMHGNLHMPEETRKLEESASMVAEVVAMGPEAYADKAKFPEGPWCQTGDFVMMRAYAGTRFTVRGTLYSLINDDTVQAVIREVDPVEIERPT